MNRFIELIKEYFIRSNVGISWFDEMENCNEKPKKKYPMKMDFSKKVLHSQVICRKPKYLIKKVI